MSALMGVYLQKICARAYQGKGGITPVHSAYYRIPGRGQGPAPTKTGDMPASSKL
ncbi:MAG TPA: hypothetical protein PK364_12360 [Synergistaceae bacterium]|nr:hypothetical protein [Synergistaceae bacterium]